MSTVRLSIGASVEVDARSLPEAVLRSVTTALTHTNPAWEKAVRFHLRVKPEPVLRYWHRERDRIRIPRGALGLLRDALARAGIGVEIDTSGVTSRAEAPRPWHEILVDLRPYQREAVEAMLLRVQGVVRMPCGGGKTTTGAAALLRSGEPGIVVVHTRDIRDQWMATFERLSGVRPREVSGDEEGLRPLDPGEVAVAMVQTLHRAGRAALPLLRSAGALLTDEAHHVPAETWSSIAEACPARYRWGLTATPERSDGLTFVLSHLIGPTLFAITTTDLIRSGFLLAPTIVPVETGWSPSEDHYPWSVRCPSCSRSTSVDDTAEHRRSGSTCRACGAAISSTALLDCGSLVHSRALSDLSRDARRIALVVLLTSTAARNGRTVLVLCPRKEAVRSVVSLLVEAGIDAVGVTGDTVDREERIESVRSGTVPVIVATQLADEGLDLPAIDCVVNASAGRSQGRAKQRVGRSLRIAGRDPIVFELVDGGEFASQWRSRLFGYIDEYGRRALASEEPVSPGAALAVLRRLDAPAPGSRDARLSF